MIITVSAVPSTSWKVGILIPDDIFKKELSSLITIMIFIIIATLAIVITAAMIASSKITKPIITLTEIGKIATSIHELRQNLLQITLQLKQTAGSVSEQSEQVKTSLD